jgi:hypothetical protein
MVSEGLVHGHLATCFWAYCEAEQHSGGNMWRRKQKVKRGLGMRYNLQRHTPSDPFLPLTRPHLLKFPKPPKRNTIWGPRIPYCSLWGTFYIPAITFLTWPLKVTWPSHNVFSSSPRVPKILTVSTSPTNLAPGSLRSLKAKLGCPVKQKSYIPPTYNGPE